MNRRAKSYNGNRRKELSIVHWNLGSRLWKNKIHDIHDMILTKEPDIVILSEANILKNDNDYEIYIPNYSLILPKTMDKIGNCRIAILIREGINVETVDKLMDENIASIWLKISTKGEKKL